MTTQKSRAAFTRAQLRTIIGCFIAYACAYIGRLNLAQALPALAAEGGYSGAQLGWLQTIFAVTYASGQLIIGSLADRHRPLRFVLCGMLGTAVCNFCFGLTRGFTMMAVLWMLNGVCQSMLWTPVMRLISRWFAGRQRARACFIMSASSIVGHMLSWAIAAFATNRYNWRAAFFAPGAVLFCVFITSAILIRDPEKADAADLGAARRTSTERMSIRQMLFSTGLCFILVTCVANGFVRDGITTWAPSILAEAFGGLKGSPFFSLIIPFINIFGWMLSQFCFRKTRGGARPSIVLMLTSCAAVLGITYLIHPASVLLLACSMGVSCAIMQGNTPLLTAMTPMEYASADRVALVAGMIDCCIYIGSAMSGVIIGAMTDSDPSAIYPLCAAVCVIGAAFAFVSIRRGKHLKKDQNTVPET